MAGVGTYSGGIDVVDITGIVVACTEVVEEEANVIGESVAEETVAIVCCDTETFLHV